MKKFLLSLAMVIGLGSLTASAGDVTITAAGLCGNPTADTELEGQTWKSDGYNFVFAKNGGQTAPKYYMNGSNARVYANGTMTVSGQNMTKMVFTLNNVKRACDLTASTGTCTTTVADGAGTVTWTGSASEVVFTVPDKSNASATEPNKPAQFIWNQVVITGAGESKPKATDPVFEPASGTIIPEGGLTVTITAGTGAKIYYTMDGTNPTESSDVYSAPILVTTATTIKAMAAEEGKDNSAIVSAVYKAPAATVANIKAFLEKADTENTVVISGPVTVSGEFTYGSGQSLYVQDETGYLLIFDKSKKLPTYSAGDRISNFAGTYSVYNETPQMVPDAETFGAATAGEAPAAKVITVTDPKLTDQNQYVKLVNVAIKTSETNAKDHYAVSGSDQILLYNKFGITFPADGEGYDVYGYVGGYYPKEGDPIVQIYPAEIVKTGTEPVKHEAATIKEFLENAKDDANNVWTITGQVKTVYQNGNNLYVQDVEAPYTGMLVYGKLDKTYEAGTLLSGIKGKWTNYYSTIEFTAETSSFTEGTKGDAPVCTVMDMEAATPEMQNMYVEFKDVTVSGYDATAKTFTLTDVKDATFAGYNKWDKTVNIPADTNKYNTKGFISYYQAQGEDAPKMQFYPVEFIDTMSVEGVELDSDAAAEYYTIDGIRVAEPTQGIYIVRQGRKVSKMVIR